MLRRWIALACWNARLAGTVKSVLPCLFSDREGTAIVDMIAAAGNMIKC